MHSPAGKHQDSSGANACFDCTVGRYEAEAGQAECTQCPAHSSTCKLAIHPQYGGLQRQSLCAVCRCLRCFTQNLTACVCVCRGLRVRRHSHERLRLRAGVP